MIEKEYADYSWEQAEALLGVDSPSGFTHNAAQWVLEAFRNLGYDARLTGKGGVLADLGGENSQDGLLLAAHTDTLGGMVSQVKGTGRLTITPRRKMSGCIPGTERCWRAPSSCATPPSM